MILEEALMPFRQSKFDADVADEETFQVVVTAQFGFAFSNLVYGFPAGGGGSSRGGRRLPHAGQVFLHGLHRQILHFHLQCKVRNTAVMLVAIALTLESMNRYWCAEAENTMRDLLHSTYSLIMDCFVGSSSRHSQGDEFMLNEGSYEAYIYIS